MAGKRSHLKRHQAQSCAFAWVISERIGYKSLHVISMCNTLETERFILNDVDP